MMKQMIAAITAILAVQPASLLSEPDPPRNSGMVVVLIDDQTGVELADKHGIRPLAVGDLGNLFRTVLQEQKPVSLLHIAVDEKAADNPVSRMDFNPYDGGSPPKKPSTNIPLRQLGEEMKAFRERRATWQRGRLGYIKEIQGKTEEFVRTVTDVQLEVAERFDDELERRNGRDFNRSDIVGCITLANELLKTATEPVLVLNTDGVDLPGHREPRDKPLTAELLDPRVRLIFVNTSRLPEKGILFRGLPNDTRHADSVEAAMTAVQEMLRATGQGHTASNR